jgi:D-glycero-D-manno-heptose 1,7-bisphosphate phosphatase
LNNKADITFLVQARKIGNVKITLNHRAFYNSDKRNSEYQLVELGNISIKTPKFMLSLQTTQDLPKTLEQLSEELQCSPITSESSFKSISNFETYIKNLQGRKIVLLDRDGILIKKMPHRKYLSNMKDYNPIYENWNCLKEISRLGVDFIIVTNQPGVATGEVSEEFVTETHVKLVSDLLNYGINILSVYVCKHHWDENCDCRKPKPGMLLRAMQAFEIDPSLTLYIGDELKDCLAASSAGVDYVIINRDLKGQFIYNNLAEAMPIIHSKLFKLH